MKHTQRLLYNILLIIIAASVTTLTLYKLVSTPDRLLLELGGDSLKNYFSFVRHATEGNGFAFSGMNYPYGENIIYADGQPLFSIALQAFNVTENQALAVIHWAIVIGFFLCIIYCYKILRYYDVHPVFAIIGSCLVTVMSPQLIRVFGHFGLSYMCAIPMLFYWSIKYHDQKRLKYALFIFIEGTIFSLLHPYWAAIFFIWVSFYSLSCLLLFKGAIIQRFKHILPMVLSAGMIVVIVKLLIFFTDGMDDRTTYPYGMFSDCTTYISLLTSNMSPIWTKLFGSAYAGSITEGVGYIGIVGELALLVAGVLAIVKLTKKGYAADAANNITQRPFGKVWLALAFFAVVFAHGAPLIWMKWSIDYISIFRQFRTLGRFVWLYYYIGALFTVVYIYRAYLHYKTKGKHIISYGILIMPMLIWAYEANSYIRYAHDHQSAGCYNYDFVFNEVKCVPDWNQFLAAHNRKATDFQAIIALPYFHIGSEKLWIYGDDAWIISLAFQTAFQTHLPLFNVHMSRTSWSQTFEQVRILAGPYGDMTIMNKLPDSKPILLIALKDHKLNEDEQLLIQSADSIGVYEERNVYALYPDRLTQNSRQAKDNAMVVAAQMYAADTCIGADAGSYIIDHFDSYNSNLSLIGKGAITDTPFVKNYKLQPNDSDMVYEMSIWAKVNDVDYRSPYFSITYFDASGNKLGDDYVFSNKATDNAPGMWLRAGKYIKVPAHTSSLSVEYDQGKDGRDYIAMDELQLRPVNSLIVSKFRSDDRITIVANNHIIGKKKQ